VNGKGGTRKKEKIAKNQKNTFVFYFKKKVDNDKTVFQA